jgi:hypothetical protein
MADEAASCFVAACGRMERVADVDTDVLLVPPGFLERVRSSWAATRVELA